MLLILERRGAPLKSLVHLLLREDSTKRAGLVRRCPQLVEVLFRLALDTVLAHDILENQIHVSQVTLEVPPPQCPRWAV